MESEGIGRPSTYAPTIATIQQREYIIKTEDKKFSSLLIDSIVSDLPIGNVFLAGNFADIQISKNNKVEILDGQQRLITLKSKIIN